MKRPYSNLLGILSLTAASSLGAQKSPRPKPSPPPTVAVTTPAPANDANQSRWSNFYAGVNAGQGWNQFKLDGFSIGYGNVSGINVPQRAIVIVPGTSSYFGAASTDWGSALALGLHAGYKRNAWNRIWRIEADFNSNSREGSTKYTVMLPGTALTLPTALRLERALHSSWTSSLRARGDGEWRGTLLYGTAGLAAARATATARDSTFTGGEAELAVRLPNFVFIPFGSGSSQTQTHLGWTVGVGTERNWSPRTTFALEYRYSNFGSKMYRLTAVDYLTANATQAQFDAYLAAHPGTYDGTSPAHGLIFPDPQKIRLSGAQVTARVNVRLPLW